MRLTLIRHPQPEVAPGVCYGRTDLAVAAHHLEQAVAALLPVLPAGVPLFSSPLQRCAALALRLTPAPVFDARLVEMDFGSWEMHAWDSIARASVDAWAADLANYRPGGGESVLQMAERVATFYADLQRQLAGDGAAEAIVVCHAGTMRLLAARHAGLAPLAMALQAAGAPHQLPYGQTLVLPHRDGDEGNRHAPVPRDTV
ncbi:phosphoglycerate mutase [Duganella sp. Leaf126]|uniref:histidine phosphatase family protein n=1 Tax=Duganella sp. Leaf126 TaxID=1736266 RepID=UPI0006F9B3B0|nr:histidine phosphatase family protein [Duganella sp. Leaf126]KQQ42417.1 phosphoglycerate mutase [Duganella sp. Leaf126]